MPALFPVGGYGETWVEHWYYLFLPALTLAIAMCPTVIRSLRASTINVLGSDYVGTARSKGAAGIRALPACTCCATPPSPPCRSSA